MGKMSDDHAEARAMASRNAGVLSGADALRDAEAWIAATDAALAATQTRAVEARGALREAINQLAPVSALAADAADDDRQSWQQAQTVLYEAANRWLWLASHRDLTARFRR
jgi:hypothetical protein